MKAVVKKRMLSRKKQSKKTKPQPVSSKKTSNSDKSKKPVKNSPSTIKAAKRGHKFVKGQSGNPKGRPKGSKNKFSVCELLQGIANVEKKKGRVTFFEKWVESAWGTAPDMATIANFVLPKKKSIEQISIPGDSIEDRRKNLAIQKVLQERCKTEADKKANGTVTI